MDNNWISVKKRKPKVKKGCSMIILVYLKNGNWCEAYYWGGEFRVIDNQEIYKLNNVTHWMIPSPPKP